MLVMVCIEGTQLLTGYRLVGRVHVELLTFASRYKKIAAVADITEIQMHHGSGMSTAGQWNLSQVIGRHSKS